MRKETVLYVIALALTSTLSAFALMCSEPASFLLLVLVGVLGGVAFNIRAVTISSTTEPWRSFLYKLHTFILWSGLVVQGISIVTRKLPLLPPTILLLSVLVGVAAIMIPRKGGKPDAQG